MHCKGTQCPACREEQRNERSDGDYSDEGIGIYAATYLDCGGGFREPNCEELVVGYSDDDPGSCGHFSFYVNIVPATLIFNS